MDHAKRSSSSSGGGGGGSAKTQRLLKHSAHLLRYRDFSASRKLALLAKQSDPSNPASDQILAVADVLLAAGNQNTPDWCSILQIPPPGSQNPTLVQTQFEKLKALLKPSTNGFAFSREAFELLHKARAFLSDPDSEKKTHFGNGSGEALKQRKLKKELVGKTGEKTFSKAWSFLSDREKKTHLRNGFGEAPKQRKLKKEMVGRYGGGHDGEDTFWTLCPYCYYMFEYEKVYEGCCLRCQNCRRAFHGVAIEAPSSDIVMEGKEQYSFCFGCFQMEYGDPKKKKAGAAEVIGKNDKDVVVISDDDDDVDGNADGNVGFEGMDEEKVKIGIEGGVGTGIGGGIGELRREGKMPARRVKVLARRMKSMKSKSVARNTKKIMGNWMRSRRIELMDNEKAKGADMSVKDGNGTDEGGSGSSPSGSGSGIGGMVFFEEEDDIFAGIGNSPI